jgi:hypothetical protein
MTVAKICTSLKKYPAPSSVEGYEINCISVIKILKCIKLYRKDFDKDFEIILDIAMRSKCIFLRKVPKSSKNCSN